MFNSVITIVRNRMPREPFRLFSSEGKGLEFEAEERVNVSVKG